MSMNPEQESFEQLRRLLKLKRYEQPPPRYFNDFSSQVIGRIKMDARGGPASSVDDLSTASPWVRRLFDIFQTRPALFGGLGAAICALLISGVVYSEKPSGPQNLASESESDPQATALFQMPQASTHLALVNSTNPVIKIPGSLFDQVPLTLQPDGPALVAYPR